MSAAHPHADVSLAALYGSNTSVLQTQERRHRELRARFDAAFPGATSLRMFSSPGRTEIGGNHTDHNHGRVLAAAVGLDILAVVAPNGLNTVRVVSEGYPRIELNLSELAPIAADRLSSRALVRGVCERMRSMGLAVGGFDACVDGIVPRGAGLSSSAAYEVLMVTITDTLFNGGSLEPTVRARIAQYSENEHFGKPCGLMDQTACACGGLVTIDFEDVENPKVRGVTCDLDTHGFDLYVTNTGGSHADLNDDYSALESEMKAVARELGQPVLRGLSPQRVIAALGHLRPALGDRAILRALHFFGDDERVVEQVHALEQGRIPDFLRLIIESGISSWTLCQNCYSSSNVRSQGLCVGLAISERLLAGSGAWRVHGGGFEGTIQAFVPRALSDEYRSSMEQVFGEGSCHRLFIRQPGAVCLG